MILRALKIMARICCVILLIAFIALMSMSGGDFDRITFSGGSMYMADHHGGWDQISFERHPILETLYLLTIPSFVIAITLALLLPILSTLATSKK
jgi:hypothetical protein